MNAQIVPERGRPRNEWWSKAKPKLIGKQASSEKIQVVFNPQLGAGSGGMRSCTKVITDFALNSSAKQQALERVDLRTFT